MNSVELCPITDTIARLAEEIARSSPDCADKAMQIAALVRDLDQLPDREAVQDALEMELVDTDLSEPKIHTMTSAVLSAIRRLG